MGCSNLLSVNKSILDFYTSVLRSNKNSSLNSGSMVASTYADTNLYPQKLKYNCNFELSGSIKSRNAFPLYILRLRDLKLIRSGST